MGIFDSLKNMTNQAVKNNVSKAVSGAVNNAMHKSKTFVFADYPKNADELIYLSERGLCKGSGSVVGSRLTSSD